MTQAERKILFNKPVLLADLRTCRSAAYESLWYTSGHPLGLGSEVLAR
jgi:hypothetical protein